MKKTLPLLVSLSILTLLLSACSSTSAQNNSDQSFTDHDVIIIGAGMSGLSAANQLQENGIEDVLILEAQDRIGGRVWTDTLGESIAVDLGASWIHGELGNPLTELADEHGVIRAKTDYENDVTYNESGIEIEINEDIWDDFQDATWDAPDAALSEIYEDFIEENELDEEEKVYLSFLINTSIENEFAADFTQLSANSLDAGAKLYGDDVLFPGGYGQLIDILAEGQNIELESPVTAVNYEDTHIEITTADGTVITTKHVLSTVPLGVLKKGYIEFSPDLPEEKQEAIELLDMGVLNKTYLLFDEVFWDEDVEVIAFVSEQKGYWSETINLYPYIEEPVLMMFNAGEYGEEIEAKSDEVILNEALGVLETMYGEVPELKDSIITRWSQDEWTGGSYSYLPKGVDSIVYEQLADPVNDRLFFAGEATHSKHPSTVHGAFLSGQRAADEIAEVFLFSTDADQVVNEALGSFIDIPTSSIYHDATEYLFEEGIVEGYSDGTYRPSDVINRAEFTKIIVEALHETEEIENCTSTQYSDVSVSEWYAGPICLATQNQWVSGYEDGTYQPGNEINFVEASKILTLAFNLESAQNTTDEIPWYENYVINLAELNSIPTSILALDQSLTRGQMAEMLYRIDAEITDKSSLTYEDFDSSSQADEVSESPENSDDELSESPDTYESSDENEAFTKILTEAMEEQDMPALSVLIFNGEEVLFEETLGYSNLETQTELDSDDLFLIASISKTATATALMTLYDEGELLLSDPINDYLPFEVNHPDYETAITIEMLLTHTSGIADGPSMDDQYFVGQDSTLPLLDFMEEYFNPEGLYYDYWDNFQDFEPGTENEYSNIGSALLAVLVEEVGGQDFNDYSKEKVFGPLGMESTYWMLEEIPRTTQIVTLYPGDAGERAAVEHYTFTDFPNGGLRTTAQDLHKFMLSYQNATLLKESTIIQMFTPQIPNLDHTMGLHWFLMNEAYGLWGHDGGEEGVSTNMAFNPENGVGVVILSNASDLDLDEILEQAYEYGASL
jgi:CubicO group peptidase (beta-lactamase class C family)/monoamine oxidase